MGFKKAAQKKKKSKKKSPSDREWSHEGGQQLTPTNVSDSNGGNQIKKGRRRTQERDERQRRGRSKVEIRKAKQAFIRKMSNKVSFSQILGLEEDKEKEEDKQKELESSKKRKIEPNPMKSNSQLYKKFRSFFVESNRHSPESDSDIEDDNARDGEEEEDDEEEEYDDNNDLLDIESRDEENWIEEANSFKVGLILRNPTDIEHLEEIVPPSGVADWFFSSKDEDNSHSATTSLTPIKITDLEISPTFSATISGKINSKITPYSIKQLGNIPQLHTMWGHLYQNTFSDQMEPLLLSYLSSYVDLLVEGRDEHCNENILYGTLWHMLGHIVNSRIAVMKHDKYLKKQKTLEKLEIKLNLKDKKKGGKKKQKEVEVQIDVEDKEDSAAVDAAGIANGVANGGGVDDDDDHVLVDGGVDLNIDDIANEEVNVQDSGYTRPRVLILCPFRSTALQIVTSMKDIFNVTNESSEIERTTIKNWEKFVVEYSVGEEEEENSPADQKHKPSDWQSIFKDNLDDDFKMGIQINPLSGKGNGKAKGVHMRLFTEFYHSDIILASPLGLRLILENNNNNNSSSSNKSTGESSRIENDYLSSLEMIYLHQADVLYMQNWSHVEFILQHCNQLPHNKTHSTIDFTRIRPYFLDNLSKQHRQMIISTNFNDPVFNSLLRRDCQSKSGLIKIKKNYLTGCLNSITSQVKQIFNIIPTTSFQEEEQERFQYFCSNVLTPLLRLKQSHTLIVTPSYLHFVQVRNELLRREANAAFISEYSRESEISRGRSQFYHGLKEIMLYSGRAHFFRRFRIRGARHIIFYSLPEYAQFYPEIVNLLGTNSSSSSSSSPSTSASVTSRSLESSENQTSCIVLCTKYEKMALERIVGVKRCNHMLASGKTTFMFY